MPQSKINSENAKEYILPELTILEALFTNLNLVNSLKALSFLKHILSDEIQQQYGTPNQNHPNR